MPKKIIATSALTLLSSLCFAKKSSPDLSWDNLSVKEVYAEPYWKQLQPAEKKAVTIKTDSKRQLASDLENELSPDYKPKENFLLIRDPILLEALEQRGFDFYSHFGAKDQTSTSLADFAKLNKNYRFIADTIRADLEGLRQDENKNKALSPVGPGMAFSRRLFDANWFLSPYAHFELIGVINRLDRASFDSSTCGETRFIYRLAYTSKVQNYSRLPLTIMVKYKNMGQATNWPTCKEYAKTWTYPENIASNLQLLQWMQSEGPLNAKLREEKPQSFELNVQAMRIPSKARADLAGHGTYLLRSFALQSDGSLNEGTLENTPDVQAINGNKELKSDFLAQFKDRHFINRLSEGILKLEPKYLAKKAWSYSPYGIARKENRLFDQIVTEADLKDIEFDSSSYVRSSQAAIMRLNDLSCVGCHQARAHAGFHFLGIDKKTTHPMNSLFSEGSGHFEIELKRRTEYMKRISENLIPNPRRDFSFSPGEEFSAKGEQIFKKAGAGHFCGLNGGAFSHWQCQDGLTCQSVDEAQGLKVLGKCFPAVAMSGDPVLLGTISQSSHQNDKLIVAQKKSCGKLDPKYAFGIFENSGGFPSGICYRRNCKGIDPKSPTETCADSAGAGFNQCIAQTSTGKISFSACLEKTAVHYGFARCDEMHACRNDFVCARSIQGEGFCTPSYFLFQVRLDGHADPLKGL